MLRKTMLLAGLLLTLSPSLWASQGFYAGLGVGPRVANINQDSSIVSLGNFNVKNKVQLAANGGFASLFGGYAWYYKKLYLAGELNADISSDKSETINDEYVHASYTSAKYKMYNNFGISVLPGVLVADKTVFYGRLGYSAANFRSVTSDVSLQNINAYVSGFRYGLGIKQNFTPNLGVRLEYSHVSYTSLAMNTLDGIVAKNTSLYPQTTQVEFGVVYSFA